MRVVADDERALVAWLPGGTQILAPTLPDGGHVRDRPLDQMFTTARVQGRMLWKGAGTLRVLRPGSPWSAWLFWRSDGTFDGWYVNLETPHRRDGHDTLSADHILDVLVEPDGTCRLKDEHELRAAVEQGRYTGAEADEIRAEAADAVAAVRAGEPPFGPADRHWQSWRPDPGWTLPELPADLRLAPTPAAPAPRLPRAEDSRY